MSLALSEAPRGELTSRVLAMPTETNPKGDIFGGWIMSLMDMAGKMSATMVATFHFVAVDEDGRPRTCRPSGAPPVRHRGS